MRREMSGLALMVQEGLGRDSHADDIYVFRGKAASLVMILWHDGGIHRISSVVQHPLSWYIYAVGGASTPSVTFKASNHLLPLHKRMTHHVSILEMNGESYRLAQSRARKTEAST